MVALSVDSPLVNADLALNLGVTFPLVADDQMKTIKAYGLVNPDRDSLPLHSLYVLGPDRKVLYRKVAGRRPLSTEVLEALDFTGGRWPTPKKLAAIQPGKWVSGGERKARQEKHWADAARLAGEAADPKKLSKKQTTAARKIIDNLKAQRNEAGLVSFRALVGSVTASQDRQHLTGWILGEAFLAQHAFQRTLAQRIAKGEAGALQELIALSGDRWMPFKRLLRVSPAFFYVLQRLPR